jgi:uncharacterized protein YcsI (UPF0317 family)
MNFFGSTPKHYEKPSELRLACRSGSFKGQTSGQAPGYAQGNLCILPKEYAYDFLLYCVRNPKPCPLLHVLEAGTFTFGAWGKKVDIRTDLPRYRIFRDGVLVQEVDNLLGPSLATTATNGETPPAVAVAVAGAADAVGTNEDDSAKAGAGSTLWQDDFVTFVIGCSFSFEEALSRAGIPIRHIEQGRNVPMYRTTIPTEKAGIFEGPLVVSMRPMSVEDSIRAIEITSRYPKVHGSPVFVGKPVYSGLIISTGSVPELGIVDIGKPDFGDAVDIKEGEVCVFWACGVTPQAAVQRSKPKICITHAPGCMIVLDTKNEQLSSS